MRSLGFCSAFALIFALPVVTHAEIFCVEDSTGLTSALATAGQNNQSDEIRIKTGTHLATAGGWQFISQQNDRTFNLTISGGWPGAAGGCTVQNNDPFSTTLSGGKSTSILTIQKPSGILAAWSGAISISNLRMAEGFSATGTWWTNSWGWGLQYRHGNYRAGRF